MNSPGALPLLFMLAFTGSDPYRSRDLDTGPILDKLREWSEDETQMCEWLESSDYVPPFAALAKLISTRNGSDEQLMAISELRDHARASFVDDDENAMAAADALDQESRDNAADAYADSMGDL